MTAHVWDFIDEFTAALVEQLKSDEERWGNTWLARKPEGQEERTIAKFTDYFDQYRQTGKPLPWLKIVGIAMICWIREKHPELWK
jgi:hypothetical protein